MVISNYIYLLIEKTIGTESPERGGILGIKNGIVSAYFYDKNACVTKNEYIPDIDAIQRVIEIWAAEGIAFAGIIHSHPKGIGRLSKSDIGFAREILRLNGDSLKRVYFPIVTNECKGGMELIPYSISLSDIKKENLIIKKERLI